MIIAPMANSAANAGRTPNTIPAIAPPDNPLPESGGGVEVEADAGDAPLTLLLTQLTPCTVPPLNTQPATGPDTTLSALTARPRLRTMQSKANHRRLTPTPLALL